MRTWELALPNGEVVTVVEAGEPQEAPPPDVVGWTQLEDELSDAKAAAAAAWEAYRDLASQVVGPEGPLTSLDPDKEWMRRHWSNALDRWKKAAHA